MNHLQNEKSPCLLQHASNPLNWYPWCKEAFEKAKKEDKPLFLSIGYSTCHWCHVMERESFQDKRVAELLKQYLVSIKVDREERSDIEVLYMTVCQALTGRDGWPLSIFMTQEKEHFLAATYIPKDSILGIIGLTILVQRLGINRLFYLTGNPEYEKIAVSIFRCFASNIIQSPSGLSFLMSAYKYALGNVKDIVITGPDWSEISKMVDTVWSDYNPFVNIIVFVTSRKKVISSIVGYLHIIPDVKNINAFICSGKSCSQPILDKKT